MSGHTPQDGLLANELSTSLREFRFSKQEFPTSKPVSNIKYPHLGFQNNNLFHLFNDQLNYILATYFAESETTKGNVDRFVSNPLMAPLTMKLSYQNDDKWMEKPSDILWDRPNNKWINYRLDFKVVWRGWLDEKFQYTRKM